MNPISFTLFSVSVETKESQTTSTTKVGVASNAEVDVIVTKNATVSKSDNEEVIKEVVKTLTPMVTEFVTNAVKVVGQTVSEIVEFVWNQWKGKHGNFSCFFLHNAFNFRRNGEIREDFVGHSSRPDCHSCRHRCGMWSVACDSWK